MANSSLESLLRKSISLKNDEAFKQDIYYLAQKVFSLPLEELVSRKNLVVNDNLFNKYLERYLNGEPLYYILNEAPFYGRNFYVDNRVLIPRNETEELVYLVKEQIRKRKLEEPRIIDIGSGSGCIAITLNLEVPSSHVTSVDISLEALEVAKKNNEALGARVNFYQSDCLNEVINRDEHFDVLVSNPPYIDRDNFVEQSVLDYEPHLALFADNKGLAIYERIFKDLDKVLSKEGMAFFEISPEQEKDLSSLIEQYLPGSRYEFIKDMNGFIRILSICR